MSRLFRSQSGQSLVEIIVALAIFSLVALATSVLFLDSITSLRVGNELSEGTALAYEGLDASRSIRDNKWLDLSTGTHGLTDTNGYWEFTGSSDMVGDYTRVITVEDVERDGSFDITGSGTLDPRTKLVTVTVSWDSRAATRSTTITAYLTDWNVFDWLETNDTEFGAGTTTDIEVNNTGDAAYLALAQSASCFVVDDTQVEFDAGSYSDTQWDTDHVELNGTGVTNGTGSYTSDIFDLTADKSYETLSWVPSVPYGKELPDGGAAETAYSGTVTGGGTVGEIGDSVLDSEEYNTSDGDESDLIHVSGDIYAVAYSGPGDDGWLATVDIDSSGTVSSVIDTLEFDTSRARDPDIVHVSGDIFAIAYEGNNDDGFITTVDIDSSGNIAGSTVDSWEFDTSNGEEPSILNVSGDIFAISYTGSGDDGFVITVDIDTSGNITSSAVDSLEYDTSRARDSRITSVSGDIYAIAYEGNNDDGWLVTVDIDASGTIAGSTVDSFEFDTTNGEYPIILNVSGDIFAIAYSGSGDDGWLVTVDIDSSGTITSPVVDSFEYDTSQATNLQMVAVGSDTFAIAYQDSSGDGQVFSLSISSAGSIGSVIDTFEFDASQGDENDILQVSGDTFAIAYTGPNDDGFISTIDITSSLGGSASGNFDMSDNQFLLHMNETSGTTFDDTSANDNDATCSSCPTLGSTGKLNNAFDFDGSSEYITAGADLGQWLGGDASLSFWLNTTQSGNDTAWAAPGITGIEESGGTNDVFWGWIDASGNIGIQAGDTAGAQSTTEINDGEWHHVLLTRDATSGEVNVYIDGVLEDTATSATGTITNAFDDIGRIDDTGGSPVYYDGLLDELAVFDTILGEADAEKIWRRGAFRLRLQVRSCDDASCSGESFAGPDGTGSTYYEEANNTAVALPSFDIENQTDNQYIQYQVTFETDDSAVGPDLLEVRIDCSDTSSATGPFQQESSGDFLVVMEAENFDTNTPQGSHAWNEITTTAGYVGDGYMRAEPDSGTNNNTGYESNSPHLEFQVDFMTTGTHYVWVRGYSTSGTDDSVHAGLDGVGVSTADRIDISSGAWTWSKATMDGSDATISVGSTGEHTVDIWMREDGFSLDRILLTTNSGYTPTGDGPTESERESTGTPTQLTTTDDDQTDFDAGTYSDTQWDTTHVELDATGLTNGTGTYTSEIFDSTDATATWDEISWLTTQPVGKELPNSAATESGYTEGNADMTNNVLLMHMNESSGTIADSSGNSNDGTQSGGVTYGTSAILNDGITFDGVDDLITVSDAASLDLSDDITIEGWLQNTSAGGTIGDIQTSIVDSLEFDANTGREPDVIHISGNVYAIVYRGPGNDGWIETVTIDGSGTITGSVDTLEYNTALGREADIIHVSGDIYAIAYRGPQGDGWITTVDIDSAGNIAGSIIDTFEFDTANGIRPAIVPVSGDIYAIVYQGTDADGFVITVDIDTSGNIAGSVLDTFEYETTNGRTPDAIQIDSDTIAFTYRGDGADGFVSTVDIDGSGNISALTDTLEFDTTAGDFSHIISIDSNTFAVSYQGAGTDGWVATFDIDTAGNIGSLTDSYEFDTTLGRQPSLAPVGGDVYAISYSDTDSDGQIITLDIDSSGTIGTTIDSYEFETTYGYETFTFPVSGDIFGVAYRGPNDDGFLVTIEIDTTGSATPAGIVKSGAYELTVDTSTAYATINSTTVSSATLPSGINHVAMTYDKDAGSDQIKLYINGVQANTGTLTDSITTNANDLIIGQLATGTFDEIAIYSEVLDATDILNHYKRGALDLEIQVRSCDDAACAGESFIGPDGTGSDYYEELDNSTTSPPDFTLTNVPDNQYFQYQVTFTSDDNTYSPELRSVSVDYTILVVSGGSGDYEPTGTFESQVLDSDSTSTTWETLYWTETLPTNTDATIAVRTGNTATPDGTWSSWSAEFSDPAGADLSSQSASQYLQYRVTLTTTDFSETPEVADITITYK